MEELRQNYNKLVEETLVVEDPRLEIKREEEERLVEMEEQKPEVSEKSQDFSQDNEFVNCQKIRYTATRIKYSTTRIKSRNCLSNIAYTGISKEDLYNENLILDIYVLMTKNLNPFSHGRKLGDKMKHEMIYMIWRECMPAEFYKFICEEKNFVYVNGKNFVQPGVLEIVGNFIDQDKKNLRLLQQNLSRYKNIFQFVYANVYPEIYSTTEK